MFSYKPLFSYRQYWAKRFGVAAVLPTTRSEMEDLGWDACDVILVTGDAYVDHPSFGMAVIGRVLEAQGFRVGIIAQPDWTRLDDFMALGRPTLFFGVTAGNMDSMVNRYTADRKIRSEVRTGFIRLSNRRQVAGLTRTVYRLTHLETTASGRGFEKALPLRLTSLFRKLHALSPFEAPFAHQTSHK